MTPEIKAIEAAMREQGKTRADLGRLLGLDSSQVTRTLGGKRRIQVHEMRTIEEWLGWKPGSPTGQPGNVLPMPNMIPVYGWVGASSAQRLTIAEQNIRSYVPIHPNQVHARGAFALEVADVSMVPRYELGELAYVTPNRQPLKGQDCVVVLTDGEGLLKRFLGRDEEFLYLHQLNPQKDLDPIPLSKVESISAVVGR